MVRGGAGKSPVDGDVGVAELANQLAEFYHLTEQLHGESRRSINTVSLP